MSGAITRWMLGAAGLVVAAGVGRWTADPAASPQPATVATVAEARATVERAAVRERIDRAQMRAEIRAAVSSAMVAPPRADDAGDDDATTPREVQLSPEAEQVIAGAIGRAAWSEDDWRALDELSMRGSPEEAFEASRRIAVAVNSGQIKRVAPPLGPGSR